MLCALFVLVIFSMLALAVSGKSRFPLINKVVATVVMPVENALVAIGNTGDNIRGYWRALTVLQSENEELKRDNVELRNANVAMAAIYAENKQLRELLNYKEQHRTQTTRAAKVIARNFGDLRDSMYINIGKDAGLKREMAVLDGSGLVGVIDEVYDDYSKVLLITSARCLRAYESKSQVKFCTGPKYSCDSSTQWLTYCRSRIGVIRSTKIFN